jgi:hypothetical protein
MFMVNLTVEHNGVEPLTVSSCSQLHSILAYIPLLVKSFSFFLFVVSTTLNYTLRFHPCQVFFSFTSFLNSEQLYLSFWRLSNHFR